jgi:hypothetical protein
MAGPSISADLAHSQAGCLKMPKAGRPNKREDATLAAKVRGASDR